VSAGSELTHYARHARLVRWLELFLRFVAGLLIVLGLLRWGIAIGAAPSISGNLAALSGAWQWATINLGVTYLVAGVGLWLLAPWGVVVWLYGAACEIAMHTLFAGTFGMELFPVGLQAGLIAIYFGLRRAIRHAAGNRYKARNAVRRAAAGELAISVRRLSVGAKEVLAPMLVLARLVAKEKKETTAPSG
jgi:hypothetical protein